MSLGRDRIVSTRYDIWSGPTGADLLGHAWRPAEEPDDPVPHSRRDAGHLRYADRRKGIPAGGSRGYSVQRSLRDRRNKGFGQGGPAIPLQFHASGSNLVEPEPRT